MGWMNRVTRSVTNGVQGVATGVWAVVATPLVYRPLRPVTKQAIKGGLWVARGAQSLIEMTQEEWRTIVHEAQAEADVVEGPLQLETTSSAVSDAKHTNGEPAGAIPERAADQAAVEATTSPDFTEVKGIGDDYARLLRAAGITSVGELAAREPEALRALLLDTNDTHEVVGRVPATSRLREWIERAGEHTG